MSLPVTVLSIMGGTRSGSTILDNLLGAYEGVFSAGELHYLWERGVLEGRRCACGARVPECSVWAPVVDRVCDRVGADAQTIVEWQQRAVRVRHTWRLMRRAGGGSSTASERYRCVASALYRAIADVTGCRIIVDSSKRPSDAVLSDRLAGVRAFVLHLVRDPRAVAYSWRRHKPESDGLENGEMPRHGALYATVRWLGINAVADIVRKREFSERSMLLRYEDFIANPRLHTERILLWLGAGTEPTPFVEEHTIALSTNHAVSGNPSRFDMGTIVLREDRRWREELQPLDRAVATGVAAPLLGHYGYRFTVRNEV